MADRTVHYEAAFEAFLRDRGTPYVAVDEAKKALFADAKLKSFDFVVYSQKKPNLLVDVKGRQRRESSGKGSFQTWTTERDVADLAQWEQVFGDGFRAVFAFVYWIETPLTPEPGMFAHRDRWYQLMGVELAEYRNHMRRRSAKWETVSLTAEISVNLPGRSKAGYDECMKSRSIATILAFLPMVAFVPHASAAVDEDESKVYDARLEGYDTNVTLDGSSTALLWLLLVVLGAICVGVMFMDAKRSHLD